MPDDDPTQFGEDESELDLPTVIAPKCKLIFHDDPETPADFVLFLLERYCDKDEIAARAVIGEMSARGRAVAGEFHDKVAQIKLGQIAEAARGKYPFKVSVENNG